MIVVGGGLAGLSCARNLHDSGLEILLLEAADGLGGRVRTDVVDGFLLDRGFQVLQMAYPDAQRILDYEKLALHSFVPGALIRTQRGWASMIDPWRRPGKCWQTLFNEVGSFSDRLRLGRLRWSLRGELTSMASSDKTTVEFLREECGFSQDFIERFLRPWISGMFFDEALDTSAAFFQFIFKMLASGDAALPTDGMQAIPKQIAAGLPEANIWLNSEVTRVDTHHVTTQSGDTIEASAVVLAVDGRQAERMSGIALGNVEFGATTCFYYAASHAPPIGKTLALNGQGTGPISNVCVPSNVAPSYAPSDFSLICVSIRGSQRRRENLEREVQSQLQNWFGDATESWRLLRRYDIPHAVPRQKPGTFPSALPSELSNGLFICGDYRDSASIQGALESGRKAAEAVLRRIA